MSWVAVAVAGGALIGGVASNMSAGKQADAANNASQNSTGVALQGQQIQSDQFQQTQQQFQPYRLQGSLALSELSKGVQEGGKFTHQFDATDLQKGLAPNYDFALSQGQQAVNSQQAVQGGLASGNALAALSKYTTGYAQNAYQQAFDNYQTQQNNSVSRLWNLANLGENATAGTGNAGTISAQGQAGTLSAGAAQAGNFSTQAAAAQGAGYVGAANGVGNALSSYAAWNQTQPQQRGNQSQNTYDTSTSTGPGDY